MGKSDNIMKKLKGLEPNQERLYFVEVGKSERFAYDEHPYKVYFKTQEQAIAYFKIVSTTNPVVLGKKEIYNWNYEHIKDDLKDEDLKFAYMTENAEVILGSEVMNIYPDRKTAENAMADKQKELEIKNKAKEPKDKK